jgi:hypothetical protein
MRMSNLVGTEGDAAWDAALTTVGLDKPLCGVCHVRIASSIYDDGLCGPCRSANDDLMLANTDEAQRLLVRLNRLFPALEGGQMLAMIANLLRQQGAS